MTGNSCHKITVAVNTPLVIYSRILSDLTRILRVNRRNTPTPPVETCHSYYDTEPRLGVKEDWERKRERTRKKKRRPQKRGRRCAALSRRVYTPYLSVEILFPSWTLRPACTVAHWRINHSSRREAASPRRLHR